MAAPVHPKLLKRASATRTYLVAEVIIGVLTALLVISQAWYIAQLVSVLINTHKVTGLLTPALFLSASFTGRALLTWLSSWLAVRASASVKSQLRRDVITARLARPTDTSTSTAELVTLVTSGLDALDPYFAKYLPQLGLAATVPLIIGITILITDWPSAFIIAFTLPLIPIFMILIGILTKSAIAKRYKMQMRLANHFADLVAGLPTLQVFGRAKAQEKGLAKTEYAHRSQTMKTLTLAFLSAGVLELIATISVAIVSVSIGFRLLADEMSLQTALFILVLTPEAFLPVRQVGTHFHDSANGTAAANAAFKIIDSPQTNLGTSQNSKSSLKNNSLAAFVNAGYTYTAATKPSLSPISFQINRGEILALAGRSGGGKTTALSLLMGFLYPTTGKVIFIDTNLADWRRRTAWVAQMPGMITGSVADNIRLGYPNATDAQLTEVLRKVNADFSFHKSVGEGGEGLSYGERRRVALARALLRIEFGNAELLILDEPTAGLDSETEAIVLGSLKETRAGAVVVSHRQAVLNLADRVITIGDNA